MAKKTVSNPKGAGANKIKKELKKYPFWVTTNDVTVKNMGGKSEARRKVVEFMESHNSIKH